MPIVAFEAKLGLIRKENSPPLITRPVNMLTCPLHAVARKCLLAVGRKCLVSSGEDHIREAFDAWLTMVPTLLNLQ
ncbi:hypothetical protein TNCV_4332851 [Trichonephila clavipes]|nr:hypothetical protein TNCV_4332851 [Trichonephila clavipes]